MPLRLVEASYLGSKRAILKEITEELKLESIHEFRGEDNNIIRALVDSADSQELIDFLESRLKTEENFRIIILPVEGTLPKVETKDEMKEENEKAGEEAVPIWKQPFRKGTQISREELYADISETVSLSWVQIVLVILSAVVAAIGLMRDNAIVLVGSMVLAPMLGPNVATSFSVCLGDFPLLGKSVKANFLRIGAAFLFSFVIGFFLSLDGLSEQMLLRTQIHYTDIILALSSGVAAALSYTTAISSGFIGVMVAVALIPPLATSGILFASGYFAQGLGALLLFLINMVCVNLASMLTFVLQGVSPRRWWEEKKSKQALKRAMMLWMTMLALLILIIVFFF